eukprot:TRINITY_DN72873_c0_g1_i1.p1 TRINITY_DN72873_c0_g1~~TRINITY_DN72873_c0_g1_i1.p1  ORF type:complete len:175 (-),score=31.25 TRINITY_DN72873_c0_g1_i1:369-893(-)
MSESVAESHDVQDLLDRVKDARVGMLATVCADGSLRSRPMWTQHMEKDSNGHGVLWFFSELDSGKMSEASADHEVNIAYSKPSSNLFVSVTGRARVVQDAARVKELWTEPMRAWFPKGPEDPHTAMLRVDITRGEYWHTPSSTLVHVIGYVKAITRGERYQPSGDEHRKVEPSA